MTCHTGHGGILPWPGAAPIILRFYRPLPGGSPRATSFSEGTCIARESLLSAGIKRLDACCSEASCPIAIYRLRDAMSDQLASLQAENGMARALALRRLTVAADVRRAVQARSADLTAR